MSKRSAVVLGGGMAGMSASYALARNGWEVTLVEAGPRLGGLAGSFQHGPHSFPLGYHHILHRDRCLLFFLHLIGAMPTVRWRRIRMLFRSQNRTYDLSRPTDFLKYPMSLVDKAHFARLMLRAFRKSDWSDWYDRSAADLIDQWASAGVRRSMFEPLTQIKFGLPCSEVSGAWLGARLHHREGSAPLGYVPERNWTEVLCDGLWRQLTELGVRVLTRTKVTSINTSNDRLVDVRIEPGATLSGDVFISTIPTELFKGLLPDEDSPGFREIEYTALTSVICATKQRLEPDFYWMNLVSLDRAASGVFRLESLNPTLGAKGETYLNFVTHSRSRTLPFCRLSDDALTALYNADFHAVFGEPLQPKWIQINRVPMYSPVFFRSYRNPPVHSTRYRNLAFAGNFRTFPSVVSTGTALFSGLETAESILQNYGTYDSVLETAARFRPPRIGMALDSWPKDACRQPRVAPP